MPARRLPTATCEPSSAGRLHGDHSARYLVLMDTVARALELAQSGSFQAIKDLRAALKVEGMMQVDAHLAGAAFRKQLKVLMDAASRTTG